jgi:hypothetical protein
MAQTNRALLQMDVIDFMVKPSTKSNTNAVSGNLNVCRYPLCFYEAASEPAQAPKRYFSPRPQQRL